MSTQFYTQDAGQQPARHPPRPPPAPRRALLVPHRRRHHRRRRRGRPDRAGHLRPDRQQPPRPGPRPPGHRLPARQPRPAVRPAANPAQPSAPAANPAQPTTPAVPPSAAVKTLQQQLGQLNYYEGPADGIMGPQTIAAVKDLQRQAGLPQTGTMTPATQAALARYLAHGNNQMAG